MKINVYTSDLSVSPLFLCYNYIRNHIWGKILVAS
jgi:hypothetical protein